MNNPFIDIDVDRNPFLVLVLPEDSNRGRIQRAAERLAKSLDAQAHPEGLELDARDVAGARRALEKSTWRLLFALQHFGVNWDEETNDDEADRD